MNRLQNSLKSGASVRRPAFTLVELLVASAAVVIVTVGIAQIFQVTGSTVASGRKLSNLTTFAASLERQLRADFAGMTRKGFLMIRHQGVDIDGNLDYQPGTLTNPGLDLTPLYPGDPNPRGRRADELVFFAEGDFSTLRDPRHPDRIARGSEARVYYGHGHRRASQDFVTDDSAFASPVRLDDFESLDPTSAYGRYIALGQPGPNQYASDWLLVRHVTLLAQPLGSDTDSILFSTGGVSRELTLAQPRTWKDSDYQVALQPAAPTIFRRMNNLMASVSPPGPDDVARPAQGLPGDISVPRFSSGVVDIATTSLAEIRATILGVASTYGPRDLTTVRYKDELLKRGLQPWTADTPVANPGVNDLRFTKRMQAWMMEALPADSDGVNQQGDASINDMRRIRAEPTAPNLLGLPLGIQADYDRTDQLMLPASVLAPRCTEFIVEWTFGEVETIDLNTQGRTVWYGLERLVDVGQDGERPPAAGGQPTTFVNYGVKPFLGQDQASSTALPATHPSFTQRRQTITRRDGSTFTRPIPRHVITPDPYFNPQYRYNAAQANRVVYPQYSIFGYIDPTYSPALPPASPTIQQPPASLTGVPPTSFPLPATPADGATVAAGSGWVLTVDVNGNGRYDVVDGDVIKPALLVDVNGDGQYDAVDGDVLLEPDTIPCPWPTLIRITISVADPADPKIEQTFQFVLPVPPPTKSSAF